MGKFQPGQSGNPAGKKPGTVNRQLAALREAAEEVLPLVLARALEGDADAQRLILAHALPKPKPISPAEPFALPEGALLRQVQEVLRQAADGELSPTVAAEVVGMVATAVRVAEIDKLRDEINILKNALERRGRKYR
jgi:hypothetical protein